MLTASENVDSIYLAAGTTFPTSSTTMYTFSLLCFPVIMGAFCCFRAAHRNTKSFKHRGQVRNNTTRNRHRRTASISSYYSHPDFDDSDSPSFKRNLQALWTIIGPATIQPNHFTRESHTPAHLSVDLTLRSFKTPVECLSVPGPPRLADGENIRATKRHYPPFVSSPLARMPVISAEPDGVEEYQTSQESLSPTLVGSEDEMSEVEKYGRSRFLFSVATQPPSVITSPPAAHVHSRIPFPTPLVSHTDDTLVPHLIPAPVHSQLEVDAPCLARSTSRNILGDITHSFQRAKPTKTDKKGGIPSKRTGAKKHRQCRPLSASA